MTELQDDACLQLAVLIWAALIGILREVLLLLSTWRTASRRWYGLLELGRQRLCGARRILQLEPAAESRGAVLRAVGALRPLAQRPVGTVLGIREEAVNIEFHRRSKSGSWARRLTSLTLQDESRYSSSMRNITGFDA